MTERITLTLPGTPQSKGRPRFLRNGRTYTDAKTKQAEQMMLAAWLRSAGARQPHAGPVEIDMTATFTPAESWPKWRRHLAITGVWPHLSKPDLDNLIKILDGLNGRAWLDDSQITHVRAAKQYGPVPQTTVVITLHEPPTKKEI